MKKNIFISLFFIVAFPRLGFADIVEVKGEGIMDGKVISEDEKEIQFKDSYGKTRTINKKNVVFMEKEKEDKFKSLKKMVADVSGSIQKTSSNLKKESDQATDKFMKVVTQPLDRSAADQKAAALNNALSQAGGACASMNKKNLAIAGEAKKAMSEDMGEAKTEKKSRFRSLSD